MEKIKTFSKPEIEKRINVFPYWYHKIELPHGVVTPGWAPLLASVYGIPERLDGMRVLDVGAWDGYWTFEALKRGAAQVVAIDDFSDYLGHLDEDARKKWGPFDTCRDILGFSKEQCQRLTMNVYEVDEQKLGRFDVVFFFGTLYHLRYPLLALDRLSSVCRSEIYVESAILDDFSPYRGGLDHGYPGQQMVMEFYPNTEYGKNDSNWWVPTLHCLENMVSAAGFPQSKSWKLQQNPTQVGHCRGFVYGKKL